MPNNRIYYAIQQVSIGSGVTSGAIPSGNVVKGLQSVGLTTNFNLDQVYEIGQLSIYQNVENIPDIEVTLNKVLDGSPPVYILATEKGTGLQSGLVASSADLAGRSNTRADLQLAIFADTQTAAKTGTNSLALVTCSGLYVSSVSYSFPIDGNFTEDVTLVGNDKLWTSTTVSGMFTGNDSPSSTAGVNRRQHLQMDSCKFPNEIPGIANGTNTLLSTASGYKTHFQNITVNCDLGRESIFELGRRTPYHRFVSFPVEVTSEFEVISISGDWIQATAEGYYTTGDAVATASTDDCADRYNLKNQTIYLETCEGTKICLGSKNKLTSVNYTGGDTGGGNVSVTYSYSNFNDFAVAHSGSLFTSISCP